MKFEVLTCNEFKSPEIESLFNFYGKLISKFEPFQHHKLKTSSDKNSQSDALTKFLSKQKNKIFTVILDEKGKPFTSVGFSKKISDIENQGYSNVIFALGGPHGYCLEVQKKANLQLSLSSMTLPHEIASVVLVEQVFRALCILRDHPYHHE